LSRKYARQIAGEFLPYVFRKEPAESPGLHADLLDLLQSDAMAATLSGLVRERELLWRLLKARAKAAQTLGAHLLQRYLDAGQLSVRQWAWLGDHALLAVRDWAQRAYSDHSDKIKAQAADALRLLDSNWDDSRAFAFQFFRERFTREDWTPQLLVGICDSVRDDVQAFGRELITRFFEQEDGIEYLLKLSQHPAAGVQLFATNFLERFAAGNPERLQALQLYFMTVLSQVNRSRVAKQRILAFLHQQALHSEAAAAIAVPVFSSHSLSASIEYRAACIQALRDIRQRYPGHAFELPITIRSVAVRGKTGVQHGV
jgi:hypothetical protein